MSESKTERHARLPKRFYKTATHERDEEGEGWTILLDGKVVHTPVRTRLCVPTPSLAEAIAQEWDAQQEHIDPEVMPLTRLANTALDRVRGREGDVADEIAAFAASDLLCYRADMPDGLVALQCERWDPVLAWFEKELGARFTLASGIIHTDQPAESLSIVREKLRDADAFALSAIHTVTTLTGSVLLALAHANGYLDAETAWVAAHVDEDWQISQWGEDTEASRRREARRAEMMASARFLALLND